MKKYLYLLFIIIIAGFAIVIYNGTNNYNIIGKIQVEEKIDKENKSLLIGSFNIQIFGESKMSKPIVVGNIISILSRYDIILIQEIRDKKGEAIIKLLHYLNQSTGNSYSMVISERLGNSSSKEQYAFFYKKDNVKLKNTYQYKDLLDDFEREPYSVSFESNNKDFVIIGIHVQPSKAFDEISKLDDVIIDVSNHFLDDEVILMGDFNADCTYLNENNLATLDLFKNKNEFLWLIGNEIDTTVSNTNCAYDRIIVTNELEKRVSNAHVYRFDEKLNLNKEQSLKVSDHYPVEFLLSFWYLESNLVGLYFLKKYLIKKSKLLFGFFYTFLKNSVFKTIFPDSIKPSSSVSLIFGNLSHLLISWPPFTGKSLIAITVSHACKIFQLASLTTITSSSSFADVQVQSSFGSYSQFSQSISSP